MRTRSRETQKVIALNQPYSWSFGSGGTCSKQESGNEWKNRVPNTDLVDHTVTHVSQFTDQLTPGYFRKVKGGEILPMNPFVKLEYSVLNKAGYVGSVFVGQSEEDCSSPKGRTIFKTSGTARSYLVPKRLPVIGWGTNISAADRNMVEVEAKARLYSQGMDVLTTAVEFHQTIAMLTGLKKNLLKSFEDLGKAIRRHRRSKNSSGFHNDIWDLASRYWLEGRFGWRILYYDIMSLMEYMDHINDRRRLIVGRDSLSSLKVRPDSSNPQNYHTYEERYRVGYPGILDPMIPGNSSILNTAWEVIPFSLFVDMFFDVQARVILMSGRPLNVSELPNHAFATRTQRQDKIYSYSFPGWTNRSEVFRKDSEVFHHYHYYEDRVSIGAPKLAWPRWKLSMGGYKPVDAAFLTKILIDKSRRAAR